MKHIKSFKTKPYSSSPYNLEDYVLLNKSHNFQKAQLIDVGEDSGPVSHGYSKTANKLYYWVSALVTGKIVWVTDWMIDRKLSDDEIEQFQFDSKLNKYNI